MAIKIRKTDHVIYASSSGLITGSEKARADRLDLELKSSIAELERKLIKEGLVTRDGKKKNALRVWYEFGKLLNKLGKRYKVIGSSDEKFFWRAVYDHTSPIIQKKPFPKRSEKWKINHFRLCGLMAKRPWSEVQRVGPWSIWRDTFDNKKILEDDRVLNWAIERISKLREQGWGHKQIRVFLYGVSERLRNLETSILTNKELYTKLGEIKIVEKS